MGDLNQKVVIKSNKYGLIVHMDPEAEYKQILEELRTSFTESAKFFKDASMAITFEGRVLTKPQEEEIIDLITDIAHIHIVCIFDKNERRTVLPGDTEEEAGTGNGKKHHYIRRCRIWSDCRFTR